MLKQIMFGMLDKWLKQLWIIKIVASQLIH